MEANKTATATVTLSPTLSTTITNTGHLTTNQLANVPYYVTSGGSGFGGGANITTNIGQWGSQISPNTTAVLELNGNQADIKINGVSLNDTLTAIQKKLDVLTLNPKLEKEWDELKALGEQYRKLESELAEKSKMWAALKKTE